MNFNRWIPLVKELLFQMKIFAKFAKKYFFNFRRFFAQKKLLDERNPTVPIHRSKSLNNGVMAV
jgi:hypothetical protein